MNTKLEKIYAEIGQLTRELIKSERVSCSCVINTLGLMGELVTEIKRIESANIKAFEELSGNRNL